MNSRIPATPYWTATILGFAVAGCFPNSKSDVRKGSSDPAVTQASYTATNAAVAENARGAKGQIFSPKRCGMSFITISRPAKDPAINENLWRVTDEQILKPEVMRTVQANGLRIGTITGSLPVDVEKVLNPPPNEKKPETVQVDLPDGDSTNVALATATEPITLLISREGKTFGKDYDDAKGFLRIVATQDGDGGVKVKIVPLIQYGPTRQGYTAAPAGPFQPQEFVMSKGQAEESFRELAATVTLRPGQVLAIGGKGEPGLSLGGFLFNKTDSTNDKVEQHVVLITAQPTAVVPDPSGTRGFFRRDPDKQKAEGSARGLKALFGGSDRSESAEKAEKKKDDDDADTKPEATEAQGAKK